MGHDGVSLNGYDMIKVAASFPAEKPSAPTVKSQLSRSASPPTSPLSFLETGAQLKAKVIDIASNGMLQVETPVGTLSAKSLVPLEIGREFWFEVVKGGGDPLLSAAVNKNSVAEILRLLSVGLQVPAESLAVDVSALTDSAVKIPVETKQTMTELLQSVVGLADPEPEKVIRLLSLLGQRQEQTPESTRGQIDGNGKGLSLLGEALQKGALAVHASAEVVQSGKTKNIVLNELVRALDILAAPRPVPVPAAGFEAAQGSSGISKGQKDPLPGAARPVAIHSGEFFKAVVRDIVSEKTYSLEIQGRQIEVHSPVHLDPGSEAWFVAADAGGATSATVSVRPVAEQSIIAELARVLRPLMNVANVSSVSQAQLQTILFPARVSGDGYEQGLQRLLEVMTPQRPEPEKIIKAFEQVGFLGFSAKESIAAQGKNVFRADFNKLLEVVALIQQQDEGSLNSNLASGALKKTARLVEAHYQFNTHHPTVEQSSDCFLFPCFFAEGAGGGEWMFSFERGEEAGAGGQENYQLSFYLSMSSLGDVFLQMSKQEQGVKGVFSLSTDEAVTHVRDNLAQLSTALQGFYEHVNLTCRKSSISAIDHLKEDLAAKSSSDSFLLVDVTA